MNYSGRRIIARVHLERKYEELGLTGYKLRDLNQLREIHNIDVNEIPGYNELFGEWYHIISANQWY